MEFNRCEWMIAWRGPCKAAIPNGERFCLEHRKACAGCNGEAVKECGATLGLVCGAPLCNLCRHRAGGHGRELEQGVEEAINTLRTTVHRLVRHKHAIEREIDTLNEQIERLTK